MYKEILVHHPADSEVVGSAIRYAIDLAAAFEAQLTALVYQIDVTPGTSGADDRTLATIGQSIANACSRAGVACEVRTDRSYAYGIGETLADFGHVRDMTVLNHRVPLSLGPRLITRAALYESGRPVVLVPPATTEFRARTVVLGWDASRAAVRALNDALPILVKADKVHVLRVTDDGYLRPGHSGLEICRHLARYGVNAELKQVERGSMSTGEALARTTSILSADLLVMGAQLHSRTFELLFGSSTEYLLTHPIEVPVLLSN